jgi:hypothetical protein
MFCAYFKTKEIVNAEGAYLALFNGSMIQCPIPHLELLNLEPCFEHRKNGAPRVN